MWASLRSVDDVLGAGLERLVVAHHRRRLRRIGWLNALDAPADGWAAGEPPPRAGSAVEVLIDGIEALPAIASAIEDARASVWIAGWHVEPSFRLRPDNPETLLELLARVATDADVRVLLWAGAPLPLFHPDRDQLRRVRETLARGGVACALDDRERLLHCHHEKLVIVDDAIAFVGGIDLTSYAGDRLDEHAHPPRHGLGWHDAAVRLGGPVVADVADHFRLRWHEVTDEELPSPAPPPPAGATDVQVVRTVPEKVYGALPRGDFRILESYLRALRSAERLVYLENQFLWSPEIIEVLLEKLRTPPSDDFRLLVVLPAKPNNGADDTRGQLAALETADPDRSRFLACTLRQRGDDDARWVYVHAKIGIVDDRWLTIGSANLNEHSLFNDSEMNVVVRDAELARQTRLRLWAEHLECDQSEIEDVEPRAVIDERWRPLADEQRRRYREGRPLTHRLVRLEPSSRRAIRVLGPLDGLLVDG